MRTNLENLRCSQAFVNLNAFPLFPERLGEKSGRFKGVQISLRLVRYRFHCVFLRADGISSTNATSLDTFLTLSDNLDRSE